MQLRARRPSSHPAQEVCFQWHDDQTGRVHTYSSSLLTFTVGEIHVLGRSLSLRLFLGGGRGWRSTFGVSTASGQADRTSGVVWTTQASSSPSNTI